MSITRFSRFIGCLAMATLVLNCADKAVEPSEAERELIEWGSFETPIMSSQDYVSYIGLNHQPDGWTVERVDYVHANRWPAASGMQSIDLNALYPGAISRRVNTKTGKKYALSFSYATNTGNVYPSSPETRIFRVMWNQIPIDTLEVMRTNTIDWKRHTLVLNAVGNDSLRFESLTGGSAGAALDSISLVGP